MHKVEDYRSYLRNGIKADFLDRRANQINSSGGAGIGDGY
jgi:hypothetical protein